MKVYPELDQKSEAWFAIRAGRPTASCFKQIITPKTWKASAKSAWESYGYELIASIINPQEQCFEGNFHTDRGNALEPVAREVFAEVMGLKVYEVGFCTTDDGLLGCSPDGFVIGKNGETGAGLEIKCPMGYKHLRYLIDGQLPDEYKAQVHGSMIVTGVRTWYFMSFHVDYRPLIVRVDWNEETDKLKVVLDEFLSFYTPFHRSVMANLKQGGQDA